MGFSHFICSLFSSPQPPSNSKLRWINLFQFEISICWKSFSFSSCVIWEFMLLHYDIFCWFEQPAKSVPAENWIAYMKLCMYIGHYIVCICYEFCWIWTTNSQWETFYHHSFELFYALFIVVFASLSLALFLCSSRLMSLFLFLLPFSRTFSLVDYVSAHAFSLPSNVKSVSSQFFGTTAISRRTIHLFNCPSSLIYATLFSLAARFPFELMAIFSSIPSQIEIDYFPFCVALHVKRCRC